MGDLPSLSIFALLDLHRSLSKVNERHAKRMNEKIGLQDGTFFRMKFVTAQDEVLLWTRYLGFLQLVMRQCFGQHFFDIYMCIYCRSISLYS